MMKMNKKLKEGIRKKIALISLAALLLNTVMAGIFVPSNDILRAQDDLCPVDVDAVLVIDRSGSMAWDMPTRLSRAKEAANLFLGNLGGNDRSALVSYATAAVLNKSLSNNHKGNSSSTEAYVNALYPYGATNIGGAISKGADELTDSGRSQAVKTIILLTDGRANKPYGNGRDENPADVAYAIEKAEEAAAQGYIIFTIGLGSDVNEDMLKAVAGDDSRYYNAPSGDDLKGIYNEIALEVCQYGSISGCKYEDTDKDNDITDETTTISGWEIVLSGDADSAQSTVDGCYLFAGLLPGTYTVSEGGKDGVIFEQTFPLAPNSYIIDLGKGDIFTGKNFGNYLPYCGNDFIDIGYSGYTDEICEIGDMQECDADGGYAGNRNCLQDCLGWGECISQESCGDGIKNGNEDCDGQDGIPDEHWTCTPQCILEYIPWCGDETIDPGEECDGDEPQVCETSNGYAGLQTCGDCLWGDCKTDEYCGDGIKNGDEQCDDGADNGAYGYCNDECTGDALNVCGNGVLEEPDEQCDDGNTDNGDGCSDACKIESPISKGDVIINELMWMGSAASDADEWVELKNMTDSPVDLGGCQLTKKKTDGAEDLMVTFLENTIIGTENPYFLISEYDREHSAINIDPDFIIGDGATNSSVFALANSDLQIKLYCGGEWNNGGDLIDTAGDGGDPLNMAGDKVDPKKSMSRKAVITDGDLADSWCTAATQENWDAEAEELGTPGAENVCNLISGYKFNDLDNDGIWDKISNGDAIDEPKRNDWEIELYNSVDFLIGNLVKTTKTIAENFGLYEFKNLIAGTYFVKEVNQAGWSQTFPVNPAYYEIEISEEDPISENNNFGNYEEQIPPECSGEETRSCYGGSEGTAGVGICKAGTQTCAGGSWGECSGEITPQTEICGNGIDEDCNGSDASCGGGCVSNCGGGGGGVITKPTIIITNEKAVYLGSGQALVTWTTNIETTRQVAYGDNSVAVLGGVPEYGYDFVNEESTDMTKEHSVTISGLFDEVVYYFRPIADRSGSTGEVVGKEVFYELGEVKGAEAPEPTPTPAPAECNYLLEYIKLGANNNPVEVEKLEKFLNEFEGEKLAVNGIYEQADFDAVSRFQEKYLEKVLNPWNHKGPTGYVYITTKKRINELYCEREFPLTPEQEAEIAKYSGMFSALIPHAETPPVGEVPSGASSEEPSEKLNEEPGEEIGGAPQEREEGGKVAGAEDEAVGEVGEEDEEGGAEESEGRAVSAYSGYSAYYPWAIIILLFVAIAAIYYFTNIRGKQEKIG